MSHKKFFWISALAAIVVFGAPTIIGWSMTPAGYAWHGASALNPGDPGVYFSYIEQGRQGVFAMYDAFTSEPSEFPLFQPWWWFLGQVANVTNWTAPVVYTAARFALMPILAAVLWWATGWALPQPGERRWGFLVALFGGGLGGLLAWFYAPSGVQSYPDLWVAEIYPSLTQMSSSHFFLVTIGILITIAGVERSWQTGRWRLAIVAGGGALLVTMLHPFHVVTWSLYALIRLVTIAVQARRRLMAYIGRWLVVAAIASPVLVYYGWQLAADPIAQARAAQNLNFTPNPLLIIISLGLSIPLAIIFWRQNRQRRLEFLPVVSLAAAYLIAIYLPLDWQRRLSHGLFVPMAWLAAPVLHHWWQHWAAHWGVRPALTAAAVCGLFIVSPLWTAGAVIRDYQREIHQGQRYVYYLSPEQQELVAAVRAGADPHRVLLSSFTTGRIVAGLTAHQVYIGHGVETLRFAEKYAQLQKFYGSWTAAEQRAFLLANHICYVVDGPRERAYGQRWQPSQWADVRLVWSGPTTRLYELTPCS